jgi:hypothetical protein
VILFVLATAEEHIGEGTKRAQRITQGLACWVIFGTALVFFKEAAVLFFHLVGKARLRAQVRMLRVAFWAHVANQAIFYGAVPCALLAARWRALGAAHAAALGVGLVFLNGLELYIGGVTKVVLAKRAAALRARARDDPDAGLA